ncbi:MAG: outer membrane protein transport protein [Candidatus Heimdallarchaeota archaeon]|nr:outer membrane protein transport protein [Candidatus Heimdallarchaeota archaeon]
MRLTHTRGSYIKYVLSLLLLLTATSTQATNGMFQIGFGAKSKAMGGVGTALALDSLAASANPAGMVHVGSRYDMGVELFVPKRSTYLKDAADGALSGGRPRINGKFTSRHNLYPVPNMGFNIMLNDRMSFGVSVIGAGLGTAYGENFFDIGPGNTDENATLGIELFQMQILPTFAYKYNDTHSFGVSPIIAAQRFSARGLGDFVEFEFSSDDNNVSDRGQDYSFGGGLRLGWQGRFLKDKNLTFGLTWASKVYMERFRKYQGLIANGGQLDIPSNYTAGIAYTHKKKYLFSLDYGYIEYSKVPAIGNTHPATCWGGTAFNCTAMQPLGDDKLGGRTGLGFGWRDMNVIKIGFAVKANSKWTYRAGMNYGKTPIPNNQVLFNAIAPAVVERHVTFGATYTPDRKSEISFMFMRAFSNYQECRSYDTDEPSKFGKSCETYLTGRSISGNGEGGAAGIDMSQYSLGVSYSQKFD